MSHKVLFYSLHVYIWYIIWYIFTFVNPLQNIMHRYQWREVYIGTQSKGQIPRRRQQGIKFEVSLAAGYLWFAWLAGVTWIYLSFICQAINNSYVQPMVRFHIRRYVCRQYFNNLLDLLIQDIVKCLTNHLDSLQNLPLLDIGWFTACLLDN